MNDMCDPDGWRPGGSWVRADLFWPIKSGDYNIMSRYVMSAMPMYMSFTGREWFGCDPTLSTDTVEGDAETYYFSTWWYMDAEPEPYGSQNRDALDFIIPDDPRPNLEKRLETYKIRKQFNIKD